MSNIFGTDPLKIEFTWDSELITIELDSKNISAEYKLNQEVTRIHPSVLNGVTTKEHLGYYHSLKVHFHPISIADYEDKFRFLQIVDEIKVYPFRDNTEFFFNAIIPENKAYPYEFDNISKLPSSFFMACESTSYEEMIVKSTFPGFSNLKHYWSFNTSDNISDIIGSIASVDNGSTFDSSGKNEGCRQFGSGNYINISGTTVYGEQTVAFWCKGNDNENTQYLYYNSVNSIAIGLRFGALFTIKGSNQSSNAPKLIGNWDDIGWNLVIVKYNGIGVLNSVKVNNVLATQAGDAFSSNIDANSFIASGGQSIFQWERQIDEIAHWNKILTDEEDVELWNNGSGVFY